MNKRKTGLTLIIVSLSVFAFTLINHLLEVKAMRECAATPGCMFCIPFWSIVSIAIYIVCIILLLNGVSLIRTKNTNESA